MIVSDFYSAMNVARWRKRGDKVSRVIPKQTDVRSRHEFLPVRTKKENEQ